MKSDLRRSGEEPEPARLRSSGGVVVRGRGKDLRVALMRSGYGTWVFPKGGLERGEDPREAARREIREEIGLADLAEVAALGSTEHGFERGGRHYAKHVDWFLFEAEASAKLCPCSAENSVDCGWFRPEQALAMLSHGDQRRLLRRALSLLRRGRGQARPQTH